jgi:hypothetical protein
MNFKFLKRKKKVNFEIDYSIPLKDKTTLEQKEEALLKIFRYLDKKYKLVSHESTKHVYQHKFYDISKYGVRCYKYLSYPKIDRYSFMFNINVIEQNLVNLRDTFYQNLIDSSFYNYRTEIDTTNIEVTFAAKLHFDIGVACTEFKNPELISYLARFDFEDLNNKDAQTNTINPYK